MKTRKTSLAIIALIITSILTLSFFVGGNHEVVPLSSETDVTNLSLDLNATNSPTSEDEEAFSITSSDYEAQIVERNIPAQGVENGEEASSEANYEVVDSEAVPKEVDDSGAATNDKAERETISDKQDTVKEQESKDKKDQYLTDPVPEGKPKPVEWQDTKIDKNRQQTATLSVTAKTILNNLELFNKNKLEVLPEDGIIYPEKTVFFHEGESVFDVLLREMQASRIHMEFVMTPIYNSNYVEGINNIYEFDCGELSGWMYRVNGWFPNYGASRYQLMDGDVIEWIYTCDLGRDIGGDWAVTGR